MTLSKKLWYTAEISLTVSRGKKSDLVYENLGPFRPIGLNSQNLPVVPITKCTSRFVKFGLNLKFWIKFFEIWGQNNLFNIMLFFMGFPPKNIHLELSTDQLLRYVYDARITVQIWVLTNLDSSNSFVPWWIPNKHSKALIFFFKILFCRSTWL